MLTGAVTMESVTTEPESVLNSLILKDCVSARGVEKESQVYKQQETFQ